MTYEALLKNLEEGKLEEVIRHLRMEVKFEEDLKRVYNNEDSEEWPDFVDGDIT